MYEFSMYCVKIVVINYKNKATKIDSEIKAGIHHNHIIYIFT